MKMKGGARNYAYMDGLWEFLFLFVFLQKMKMKMRVLRIGSFHHNNIALSCSKFVLDFPLIESTFTTFGLT
jgi:hypothetical protein